MNDAMSRRAFVAVSGATVALTVLGCGDSEPTETPIQEAPDPNAGSAPPAAPAEPGSPPAPATGGAKPSEPAAAPTPTEPFTFDGKVPEVDAAAAELDPSNKRSTLAKEPFLVGPLASYKTPGIYQAFRTQQGVFLLSDGATLIAISSNCTHLKCGTQWNTQKQKFACPCHRSEFDIRGINEPNVKAKRPLERCKLAIVDTPQGKQVQVDPTTRFRRERGEWEADGAALDF